MRGTPVEELDGGKKKLADECPPLLEALLQNKGCKPVYNKLVQAIVEESNTRNVFGKWRDEEFVSILELFQEEFAEYGIKGEKWMKAVLILTLLWCCAPSNHGNSIHRPTTINNPLSL